MKKRGVALMCLVGFLMAASPANAFKCKKLKGIPGLYELCKGSASLVHAITTYSAIMKNAENIVQGKVIEGSTKLKEAEDTIKSLGNVRKLKKREIDAMYNIAYLSMLSTLISQKEHDKIKEEYIKKDLYDFLTVYEKLTGREQEVVCKLFPDRC